MIFSAVPLSAIGGGLGLWIRDMPFSISAGIGFIALFGVAVLNGIVLLSYLNQLEKEGMQSVSERIKTATQVRFRPVLLTAFVAALGFFANGSFGKCRGRGAATAGHGGHWWADLRDIADPFGPASLTTIFGVAGMGRGRQWLFCFLACFFADPTTASAPGAQSSAGCSASLDASSQHGHQSAPARTAKCDPRQSPGPGTHSGAVQPWAAEHRSAGLSVAVAATLSIPYGLIGSSSSCIALRWIGRSFSISSIGCQLEAAVRMAWWEWRYQQSRSELYRSLDALAERFVRSADKRFRSGQISGLERSRARSDLEKWRLMAQRVVESELEIARLDLMQWIAADSLELPKGSQNGSGPTALCRIHRSIELPTAGPAEATQRICRAFLSPESVGLSAGPDDRILQPESGKSDRTAGHSDGGLCAALLLGAAFRCGCGPKGARIAASPDRGGETTHCIRGKAVVERTGMASIGAELV